MNTVSQDLRGGLRMLVKSPGFTAVAILALALGIGANTAIFSLVNGILLRPLPFPNSDRLVTLYNGYVPKGAFVGLRELDQSATIAAFIADQGFNLLRNGKPSRLHGSAVSADFFKVFGVEPELGRAFSEGDDTPGRDNKLILSHALWENEFSGNPNVIGQWVTLDGKNREIVGVMPPSFDFPSASTELWIPLRLDPRDPDDYWTSYVLQIVGRLHRGTSLPKAQAELTSILPRVRAMFPYPMAKNWGSDFPLTLLLDSMVVQVRTRLMVMLGAVGLVLLIACATVGNLLVVRAIARQREFAVRFALGAGRWRVVRQLMTETLPLVLVGAGLGFAVAVFGLPVLLNIFPKDTPRLISVSVDTRVLGFTVGLAILSGFVFGLLPGLVTSRCNLDQALRANAPTGSRGRKTRRIAEIFVIGEVAVAVIVVVGAGLLVKSLWRLSQVNPGFRASNLVIARITPTQEFCNVSTRCVNFYDEVLRRVLGMPTVKGAAVVNAVPLSGQAEVGAVMLEGHPLLPGQQVPLTWENVVSPGYLNTMNIPIIAGRGFTEADVSGAARVVVVSVSLAEHYWPRQSAIGKHLYTLSAEAATPWTIVGIAGDVREFQLEENPKWFLGEAYFPYAQAASDKSLLDSPGMWLTVRTSVDPAQVATNLREVLKSVNPDIPLTKEQMIGDVVASNIATPRATTWLFVIFATLALILGALGVYGVVSYLVVQRTHEVGVRIALGAQPIDILRLIFAQGGKMAFIGVAIGLGGAFGLMRLLSSLLYGVSATDPVIFVGSAVLLTLVALGACYLPARRAMRVDPVVALRYE